jgi:hypothetical protein
MNLFKTTVVLTLAVFALAFAPAHADVGKLGETSIVAWGGNRSGQRNVPSDIGFTEVASGGYNGFALKPDGSLSAWGDNYFGQCNVPSGAGFTQVAGGAYHGLALKSDGSLSAWGENGQGQCNVPSGSGFTQVASGSHHGLALKSDGSLSAWGKNADGQCNVPSGSGFTQVAGGAYHSLALKSDGSLSAWGWNHYGQCNVPSGTDFTQIASGKVHGLALKSDGSLSAWGYNYTGACNVPPGADFTRVASGAYHSLALKSDGSLSAWGNNEFGQSNEPTEGYYLDIAAGDAHSVALKARVSYEDLDVSGSGLDVLLQRPVTVSGDATISATMLMEKDRTMTVAGRTVILAGAGIRGGGEVTGRILAQYGSQIRATDDLTLGDTSQFGALILDGELYANGGRLTLNDRTTAQLGRLTVIDGGTLASPNGLLVIPGATLAGMGTVEGRLINQGLVAGGGAGEELVFEGLVSGAGSFTGSLVFNGGFSPGNSPASVHLDSVAFGANAELTMELGGLIAGTEHDHLDILNTAFLDGVLNVELLGGFAPEDGQMFDLFDGTLSGEFDDVILPQLDDGLSWDTGELYTFGQISVTPEPATMAMLAIGGLALLRRRRS